jgi:hypothetical protein
MPDNLDGARLAVAETRLDRMEKALESMADTLRTFTRVEFQNESLTQRVVALEASVKALTDEMPTLKLARQGSFKLVEAVLMAVGGAVLTYLTIKIKGG